MMTVMPKLLVLRPHWGGQDLEFHHVHTSTWGPTEAPLLSCSFSGNISFSVFLSLFRFCLPMGSIGRGGGWKYVPRSWFRSISLTSQVAVLVEKPPANAGEVRDMGFIPGWEDPLEKGMATHSSILAWRIPWTERPGGLQFPGVAKSRTWLKRLSTQACLTSLPFQSPGRPSPIPSFVLTLH